MSLTKYCLFINNHVGKAEGRMFNPPPHCEILRTPMLAVIIPNGVATHLPPPPSWWGPGPIFRREFHTRLMRVRRHEPSSPGGTLVGKKWSFRRPAKAVVQPITDRSQVQPRPDIVWINLKFNQLSCQHKNTNLTLISCTKCTHDPFFGIRGWKNTKNLTKTTSMVGNSGQACFYSRSVCRFVCYGRTN